MRVYDGSIVETQTHYQCGLTMGKQLKPELLISWSLIIDKYQKSKMDFNSGLIMDKHQKS